MSTKRFRSALDGIGVRLAEAREAAGQTQAAVGEAAGVSKQAVTQYESGAKRPGLEVIELAAHVLGVRAGWLAFGEEPRER